MFAIIEKKTNTIAARAGSKAARIGDKLLVSPTVAGWEDDNYKILPIDEIDPPFDGATQTQSEWQETIEADRVVRERTVTDKDQATIDAEADQRKEQQLDTVDFLLFRVAFEHENRVRVLEGKAEITAEQFRAALKVRL